MAPRPSEYLDKAPADLGAAADASGREDEFIPKAAQAQIKAALADRPGIEIHSYPGCSHAFARHNGLHYDADAAALANGRSWRFLEHHLTASAA